MTVMVANDTMVAENSARHLAWQAEQAQRRDEERRRVKAAQDKREKQLRTRSTVTVVEEGGKRRTARKVLTVCDKMLRAGQLPKHLKIAVDILAGLIAAGTGAATEEGADSTNRMTSGYGIGGGAYGSRTPPDRQLAGMTAAREMRRRIPEELLPIYRLIVAEETGMSEGKVTLSQIGESLGYKHKQAASAGAMAVYSVASIIALYLKDVGFSATNCRR